MTSARKLKEPERPAASPAQIARARGQYQSDDIQIDDDAVLSKADEGVWVQAWVWLGKAEEC